MGILRRFMLQNRANNWNSVSTLEPTENTDLERGVNAGKEGGKEIKTPYSSVVEKQHRPCLQKIKYKKTHTLLHSTI